MNVPAILQSHLDGEQVAAQVSLGGEDELFVTPTRTLIYRAEGLLSDESVEEYPHDADRLEVKEGRRKSKIRLDYGLDGTREFAVPSRRVDEALHPVLAGVLNAAGVTEPGETITQTYRFSELTLVITSARAVKHIGAAVWDDEFEEYTYEDVSDLDIEEGSVSSQIVIEVGGRPQRIKAQNDVAPDIFERLKRALITFHDFDTWAEFEELAAQDDAEAEEDVDEPSGGVAFDETLKPIEANPPELDADGAPVEVDETSMVEPDPLTDAPESDPLADVEDTTEPAGGQADDAGQPAASTGSTTDAEPARTQNAEPGPLADMDAVTQEPTESTAPAEPTESTATTDAAPDAVESEPIRATDGTVDGTVDETAGTSGFEESGFEAASSSLADETKAELAALTHAVERQNKLIEDQHRLLQQLVDELSRDR